MIVKALYLLFFTHVSGTSLLLSQEEVQTLHDQVLLAYGIQPQLP